jgi:hypothetical protein
MDKETTRLVLLDIRRRLMTFRARSCKVAAEPFEYAKVCDELEDMARVILETFAPRPKKSEAIRRRVYTPQGYLDKAITVDSFGNPIMRNGKRLLKPNLEVWTKQDAEIDRRLSLARRAGRAVW